MKASIVGLFARRLGLETLKGIVEDNTFEIKALVTHYYEPDMKTKRPFFDEFVKITEKNSIPLIIVHKNQGNLKILKNINYDFLVSNCYKYIIPEKYLKLAKKMSVNMHRSLLPKYKGLKPLEKSLKNGESETGTSVNKMVKEIDSGAILDQWKIKIEKEDKIEDLFEKLYPTQYPLLKRTLLRIIEENEK